MIKWKVITRLCGFFLSVWLFSWLMMPTVRASPRLVYDISQWQGVLTTPQVRQLKQEVAFLIVRVQDGPNYLDTQSQANLKLLAQNHVNYGVYSFSRYQSNAGAQQEAKILYQRAPTAKFYVNDIETTTLANGPLDKATNQWALTLRALTKRPVVLYSGLDFMQHHLLRSQRYYDAIWLADYTTLEPNPNFHYDLWQFTDHYYSPALQQMVDASQFPTGSKGVSFWLNNVHRITLH